MMDKVRNATEARDWQGAIQHLLDFTPTSQEFAEAVEVISDGFSRQPALVIEAYTLELKLQVADRIATA